MIWRIGQEVKTSPSHGGIWGSIPQCATKQALGIPGAFHFFVLRTDEHFLRTAFLTAKCGLKP